MSNLTGPLDPQQRKGKKDSESLKVLKRVGLMCLKRGDGINEGKFNVIWQEATEGTSIGPKTLRELRSRQSLTKEETFTFAAAFMDYVLRWGMGSQM